MYIVITKAALDFTSNTFLSWCFLLVIYRHYKVLGSSVQRTLIKEGLIYWQVTFFLISLSICPP